MGINEEIKEIRGMLEDNKEKERLKKEKKFKIPFWKRVSPKQAGKGYVTMFKINENGFIEVRKEQIRKQTIMVDGIPRLATPNYVLHLKKNPVIIQPSWRTTPFNPTEDFEESMKDGSNKKGYAILLETMESSEASTKKPMSNLIKWVIGLVFVAIIGYALISGGI